MCSLFSSGQSNIYLITTITQSYYTECVSYDVRV